SSAQRDRVFLPAPPIRLYPPKIMKSLICSLALLLLPAVASPQTTAGMEGIVRDASHSVVPHASVVAVHAATSARHTSVADGAGRYRLANLVPGLYSVEVSAPGFKNASNSDVLLAAGQVAWAEFTLDIGPSTETIVVSA